MLVRRCNSHFTMQEDEIGSPFIKEIVIEDEMEESPLGDMALLGQ